ncbi:MAG: hypothetical protein AB7K09_20415 [Planctomycetota bacterium]
MSESDKSRIAVYSTYCGTRDNRTMRRGKVSRRTPHFFISNNADALKQAHKSGWTPIRLDVEESADPVVSATQAKLAKAKPEVFEELADFEFLFYIDDKKAVNCSRIPGFIDAMTATGAALALRRHPFLPPNVLHEFSEAMSHQRYRIQRLQTGEYISRELASGYRAECDTLFWTSAILRNMRHPRILELNDLWYDHITRCGIECQISFHFVAQRFQREVMLLPDTIE